MCGDQGFNFPSMSRDRSFRSLIQQKILAEQQLLGNLEVALVTSQSAEGEKRLAHGRRLPEESGS